MPQTKSQHSSTLSRLYKSRKTMDMFLPYMLLYNITENNEN